MGSALVNALVQLTPVALVPVANRTATLTGAALNIKKYDGIGKIALHGLRATGTLTPTIEESADGSTGWAVCSTDVFAGFTAITAGTDFFEAVNINVSKAKGFIRLVGTAASTPDHTYGATFVAPEQYRP